MLTHVAGVGLHVDADAVVFVDHVHVPEPAFLRERLHVRIPFGIPVRLDRRRLDQHQFDALVLAERCELCKPLHARFGKMRILKHRRDRRLGRGTHLGAQQVSVIGHRLALPEPVGKVLLLQLAPARMEAQKREHVTHKVLAVGHARADRADLRAAPAHAVERHAVVRLGLRLAVFQRKHVIDDDLGRLGL